MQCNFDKGHVLIVSDDMQIERCILGDTARISPEAPVPIVNANEVEDKPGGGGNIALNIANLSAQVALLGLIGDDEVGKQLRCLLDHHPFETHLVACYSETITSVRVISRQQQMLRLELGNKVLLPGHYRATDRLLEHFKQCLEKTHVVVLSEQYPGNSIDIPHYIQLAKSQGKKVIVKAGSDKNLIRYQGANLLILSSTAMGLQANKLLKQGALQQRCMSLLRNLAIERLLVLRGREGMSLFHKHHAPYHLHTPIEEVYDETGVNDAVTAVISAALANDYELTEAISLANGAAGYVARKLGSVTVSLKALEKVASIHRTRNKILTSLSEAKKQLQQAQALGQKVVFTNGCFDIIHAGHIDYLQAAKQLGGCLIVAVNTDESLKRLNKGSNRPYFSLQSRLRVLAAIEAVDWVIPFNENTPEDLINCLKPDILVKGGDYKVAEVAGKEQVLANGGTVLTVGTNYLDCSSSKIINQLPTDPKLRHIATRII